MSSGTRALARAIQVQRDKMLYGLANFSAANFFKSAVGGGEPGIASGFGAIALVRWHEIPTGSQMVAQRVNGSATAGWYIQTSGAAVRAICVSGAGSPVISATYTLAPSDVGRVMLVEACLDGAGMLWLGVNGVIAGAGVAITGYTPAESQPMRFGIWETTQGFVSGCLLSFAAWRGTLSVAQRRAYADAARMLGDLPSTMQGATITHRVSVRDQLRGQAIPSRRYGARAFASGAYFTVPATAMPGSLSGFNIRLRLRHDSTPAKNSTLLENADGAKGLSFYYTSGSLRVYNYATGTDVASYSISSADYAVAPNVYTIAFTGTTWRLYKGDTLIVENAGSYVVPSAQGAIGIYLPTLINAASAFSMFEVAYSLGVPAVPELTAMIASGTLVIPDKTDHRWLLGDSLGVPASAQDLVGTEHLPRVGTLELAVHTPTAPAAPATLEDTITRAAPDAFARQGSPAVVTIDPSRDGLRALGVQGWNAANALEGPANSGNFPTTGMYYVAIHRIDGANVSGTPFLMHGSLSIRGAGGYGNVAVAAAASTAGWNAAPYYGVVAIHIAVNTGSVHRYYVDTGSGPQQIGTDVADVLPPSTGQALAIGRRTNIPAQNADNSSWFGSAWGAIPGGPTLAQVTALCASIRASGHIQGIPSAMLHLWDPLIDMAAAGEMVPTQVLDRIGTDHLNNVGVIVTTRGGARGVRLCVSSPTTGGRVAPYYRTLTSAGGIAGTASALHVSAKITVENQNAQNNHTLVSTFSTSPSNSGFILALNANNTSLIFAIYAGGATQSSAAYTVPANKVGAPLHVDGVFTGAAIQLFVDGVQIGSDVAASYTPSTSATYVGVDARDLAVTAAENVSIHAVSGGNTVITSGEIAARYAASVAAGSLQQVAGKTQRHWPIETDAASGQVPGVSAERTGAGDPLMLVGAPLQLAQRTERGWGYETSPVFQGATGFANGAYFAGSQGLCVGDQNGFFELWAFVLWPTLTSTSRVIASARDDVAYYGCQIYTTGANGMLICTCGTTAGNDVSTSPNAVASHELGKIMIAGFTVNPAAGQLQGFARRTSLVSGGFTGGAYYRPKPSLSRMVGRRSVDSYPAQDITILGGWYGQGILTLAEYQAIYDDFFATERVQRVIPQVTNAWDIRASAMPNGGIIPAQIPDLVGSVPLATYGTLSLQSIYSRAAAA